jgi:hypothetical protein
MKRADQRSALFISFVDVTQPNYFFFLAAFFAVFLAAFFAVFLAAFFAVFFAIAF